MCGLLKLEGNNFRLYEMYSVTSNKCMEICLIVSKNKKIYTNYK